MGEGHRVRFWYKPWCGPIPLKDLYPDLLLVLFPKKLGFLIWLFLI